MRSITTDTAPAAGGHYSQAIAHAGLIYVSGQLPLVPGDAQRRLAAASFEEQAEQVISNVIAVVEAAGSAQERILRTTVYIADVSHWAAFNAIYARRLGSHRPARTVVPVSGLHYGFLVEMDAIAALRGED